MSERGSEASGSGDSGSGQPRTTGRTDDTDGVARTRQGVPALVFTGVMLAGCALLTLTVIFLRISHGTAAVLGAIGGPLLVIGAVGIGWAIHPGKRRKA